MYKSLLCDYAWKFTMKSRRWIDLDRMVDIYIKRRFENVMSIV